MFFSIKYGNIELQSCDEHLCITNNEHNCAKIICWQDKFCYVIAYWKLDDEGFDLIFVGSRPFEEHINATNFMLLAKEGQERLDEYYENTICKDA